MSIYLQLLLLAWVVVFIIDLSGVTASVSGWMGRQLRKPFSCSLCMTWWLGLVWSACAGSFAWPTVAYVAALAYLTPVFGTVATGIRDLLLRLLNKIR